MPRKTKFSASWLDCKDKNGDVIKSWCKSTEGSLSAAYCTACDKNFSVANMGFSQILSHASSAKHQKRMKDRLKQSTLFSGGSTQHADAETSGNSSIPKMELSLPPARKWIPATLKEKTLRAEALILLTAVKCNYSFASMNDLGPLFATAFEDSEIAKSVKLGDAKARYIVKFGMAPYFKKLTFCDLKSSSSFFTIYFDETTTKQVKKQLDIYISFWSEKEEKIVVTYCDSFFLGHAEADKILQLIVTFISENGLDLSKLLQCSMDGPNVNLSLQRKINAHLNSMDLKNLIDIGTCSLHIMHTAMKKGVSELQSDVENFVLNIYQWFKMSSARREDFHEIQLAELVETAGNHLFQRHVSSRWLTLGPVCERIIEQYSALREYFLKVLPQKAGKQGEKYGQISSFLKDSRNLIYLHFTLYFTNLFTSYQTLFQRESPMIHALFSKQSEQVRNIMLNFLKPKVVAQKEGLSLCNINCDDASTWLPLEKVGIGSGAKKLLVYAEHKDILHNIRAVYIETCKYLQQKLPLSNPLLRDLQYIDPPKMTNPKFSEGFGRLADQMVKVTQSDVTCDIIKSELHMYMCDDLTEYQALFDRENDICAYWSRISKIKDSLGGFKYTNLTKLVKSCLTLSHGNSVPERGFSINNNIITDKKCSLSEIGIRSLRICKDFLKRHNSVASLITREMLEYNQKAHAEYSSYLEQLKNENQKTAMKRKNEEADEEEKLLQKRKKEMLMDEKNALTAEENKLLADEAAAHALLNDATQKLCDAVKNNDFNCIKVIQLMLDAANNKIKDLAAKLSSIRQKISETDKKIKS